MDLGTGIALAGLIIVVAGVVWKGGRLAERLTAHSDAIDRLEKKVDGLSAKIGRQGLVLMRIATQLKITDVEELLGNGH